MTIFTSDPHQGTSSVANHIEVIRQHWHRRIQSTTDMKLINNATGILTLDDFSYFRLFDNCVAQSWAGSAQCRTIVDTFRESSTMPSSSSRGRSMRCLQLLSCWTGCFANVLPCLTVNPVQEPVMLPEPTSGMDDSMPIRRSYNSNEEYLTALEKWKKEYISILTSRMQTSMTNGTWTPALADQIKREIERINLATGSTVSTASAPVPATNTTRCSCGRCFNGI